MHTFQVHYTTGSNNAYTLSGDPHEYSSGHGLALPSPTRDAIIPRVIARISIAVSGQGLHGITDKISHLISTCGLDEGLCTLFIRHTSASLLIQENYDDSARIDLEQWLNRLVPENDALYTHTLEGPDDMPAHIKCALTATQISVPFQAGELLLGTWQGIYLWEHRRHAGRRQLVLHL